MDDLKKKFEVVRGLLIMIDGMYEFNKSDYGRGMVQGIMATLRALGLQAEFSAYVNEKQQPNREAKDDGTVLSDRVE